MILIACTDRKGGLSYRHKRQTRDREIIRDLVRRLPAGTELSVCRQTARYLTECVPDTMFRILDSTSKCPPDDALFIETAGSQELERLLSLADRVVLYVWDTTYLYTERFPDLNARPDWTLSSVTILDGSSHPGVQRLCYERTV